MTDEVEPGRRRLRSVPDRVLGGVGVAMIAGALWLLLFGGPNGDANATAAAPPRLSLLSPAPGDTVGSPVTIAFTTSGTLSPGPAGWGADGFHLHAEIAGREVMPAPGDVRRQADGRYEWTLAGVPSGDQVLRLVWSDARHIRVDANQTEAIPIFVR